MPVCDNCHADVPKIGTDSQGRKICCPACGFSPLGCRCKFGELGVAETVDYSDPDDGFGGADNDEGDLDDD